MGEAISIPNDIKINPCLLLGESLFRTGFIRLEQLAREQHSAEMDWGMEQEFTDEQQDAWTRRLEVWAKIGEACKHVRILLDVAGDLQLELEGGE